MPFTDEQYGVLNESVAADHARICEDFLMYGRAVWGINALIDDVVKDRVSTGLWPTRDCAAPEEEC